MRGELGRYSGQCWTFTATFIRFGMRMSFGKPVQTVLLYNIKDGRGELMADHIWIGEARLFRVLNLMSGQHVKFSARVEMYFRKSGTLDYRFVLPRWVRVIDDKITD